MGVEVEWDNAAKTVIRFSYAGRWTWDEMYRAVDTSTALIDSVPHPIAMIIDMSESAGVPPGAMTHGRAIQQRAHPHVVMQVTVNAGGFVMSMARAFSKLYGTLTQSNMTHFASSVDEARALIIQKMPQTARP